MFGKNANTKSNFQGSYITNNFWKAYYKIKMPLKKKVLKSFKQNCATLQYYFNGDFLSPKTK